MDVSADRRVTALDALRIINGLKSAPERAIDQALAPIDDEDDELLLDVLAGDSERTLLKG